MTRLMTLVMAVFIFASVVAAQEEYPWPTPEPTPVPTPECDHESDRFDRFDAMRLLPPVTITPIPDGVKWKHRQAIGHVYFDDSTDKPSDLELVVKGTHWWILYCSRCNYAYSVVKVERRQIRTAGLRRDEKDKLKNSGRFP